MKLQFQIISVILWKMFTLVRFDILPILDMHWNYFTPTPIRKAPIRCRSIFRKFRLLERRLIEFGRKMFFLVQYFRLFLSLLISFSQVVELSSNLRLNFKHLCICCYQSLIKSFTQHRYLI